MTLSNKTRKKESNWSNVLIKLGTGCRACVKGELKRQVRENVREDKTGAFRVLRDKENRRDVLCLFVEVKSIYFRHKNIHMYTRVAAGREM